MGYLDTHNNGLSGNTFRLYLSDYGKGLLATGNDFLTSIKKFGLSDSDINYLKVTTEGCKNIVGSGLTTDCFHDIPDNRGGIPLSSSRNFGSLDGIMLGPKCDVVKNNLDTLGNNEIPSTLWSTGVELNEDGLESTSSAMFNGCWTVGSSISDFYPTYCSACSDFNNDGIVDIVDFKLFISMIGETNMKGNELVGDYNGDGLVGIDDLMLFMNCVRGVNNTIMDYCKDEDVFCTLCNKLGDKSPCNGDCTTCI